MAPTAIQQHVDAATAPSVVDLKAKVVNDRIELDTTSAPPLVADNFMYDFKYNHPLPTTDTLQTDVPESTDAHQEACALLAQVAQAWATSDAARFTELFVEHGVWRDKLAFTWDYRTFNWHDKIARAAADLLPATKARNLELITPLPNIQRPYPDLAYLQFAFSFDTELVSAHAVLHAVKTTAGWRVWTLHTVAEALHRFPELDPRDGHMTGAISWEKQRAKDDDEIEPDVVIVGGGQNGLMLGARLKALGVPTLIVEKDPVIGAVWRNRYEYLSLHFPHWADHFPYFAYAEHWPTYTPAQKMGLFMEWYASALELAVWTSSVVTSATQGDGGWTVHVVKGGNDTRVLKPKHVVLATSLCGVPMTPVVPGTADYTGGAVRHSTAHDSSRDFVGKRVLVVGTSSSGFDTAYDCARRGIDVTLLQRSPTYVMSLTHSVPRTIGGYQPRDGVRPDLDEQDRLFFATPVGPGEELARRNAKVLEDLDRPLLDALNAKGLRTWRGQRGTGNSTLGQTRNGGFYFDAGACEQIINGNIKVVPGYIERFTKDDVVLSGGRVEKYDLVVFATGFSNTIDSVRAILGDDIASRVGPIWGIDDEGEVNTAYRETGVDNLWIMVGFLPMARFHSKRVALRIKALLEGVAPAPYKV